MRGRGGIGCLMGLGLWSCYGSAGPQVGITFQGHPTVGWELGATSFAVGQSYRLDAASLEGPDATPGRISRDAGAWKRRTYLVWEPRLGGTVGDSSGAFGLVGGGGTIGMRWDERERLVDGHVIGVTEFGAIGGLWGGGTYLFPPQQPESCGSELRWFASLAVGFRGNEVYLAPKFGLVDLPKLCLGFY